MKRGGVNVRNAILIVVVLLLMVTFVSAGFSDVIDNIRERFSITGRDTSDVTSLNITIGNSVPTIITVITYAASTTPTENGVVAVRFNFTAVDSDGASNLNDSSAQAHLFRSGETTRVNTTCSTAGGAFGNSQNYSCLVEMQYFDGNGAWTINASVEDINQARAQNKTETFTYNLLIAMKLSPNVLTWTSIGLSDVNTLSNDHITLNNTGNDLITNITALAIDLPGEEEGTEYIYAGNFTVNTAEACEGTAMINATQVTVGVANFTVGNYSVNDGITAQELLYFCIEAVNDDLSAQSYSSQEGGAWTIAIVT